MRRKILRQASLTIYASLRTKSFHILNKLLFFIGNQFVKLKILTLVHSKMLTLPVVVRWSLNGEERQCEAGVGGESVLSLDTEKETEVAEMTVSCQAENSEVSCQAVKLSQLSHWL